MPRRSGAAATLYVVVLATGGPMRTISSSSCVHVYVRVVPEPVARTGRFGRVGQRLQLVRLGGGQRGPLPPEASVIRAGRARPRCCVRCVRPLSDLLKLRPPRSPRRVHRRRRHTAMLDISQAPACNSSIPILVFQLRFPNSHRETLSAPCILKTPQLYRFLFAPACSVKYP